jgi:hypothetical protein
MKKESVMNTSIRSVTLPALIAFALATGPALAHAGPQLPTSTPPSTKDHAQKHADAVERRIADLHAQLKITDQQAKQWDAFSQTMRDNARKADQAFRERAQKLPTMSAPDAMKSYADLTETHADNMKKLASSFSDLYDVLSPQQKQLADQMYRHPGGHMGEPGKTARGSKGHAPASASSSAKP